MSHSIKVTLVDNAGTRRSVNVAIGQSVMEAAVIEGVPGILAECGGAPQCGTCSVVLAPEWAEVTDEPEALELSVLKFTNKLDPARRLSCQLIARAELDGLTLLIPESQY